MEGGEASWAGRPERARAVAPTRLPDGGSGMDRRGTEGGALACGTGRTDRTHCRSLGTHVLGRRLEAVPTRGQFATLGLEEEAETRGGTHEKARGRIREEVGGRKDDRSASSPHGRGGDNSAGRR